MVVLVVNDEAQRKGTAAAFYGAVDQTIGEQQGSWVAFDCEGVNLSRAGSVELVTVHFSDACEYETFVVDVSTLGSTALREERIQALKRLLECSTVKKVIHDCRMDCDALYHLFGIELNNVHDTSCFHYVISKQEDANLNDTLESNGMPHNVTRDKSVYRNNPEFWADRPLTPRMIQWASADVQSLLQLAKNQMDILESRGEVFVEKARDMSQRYSTMVRDMKLERSLQCQKKIGHFIGPRGSNLRDLQRRTGAMIYQDHKIGANNNWLVFYPDEAALRKVRASMGY